jgi:hypothetical protein
MGETGVLEYLGYDDLVDRFLVELDQLRKVKP